MTSPPDFATPRQRLRSALPHGLHRRPTQTERKTGRAACSQNNHGQRHRDHLSGRNENSNPRCEPCNVAELMNCLALFSGPTSQTHPTALLLREGGRPPQVWSSELPPPPPPRHANTPQPLVANSTPNATSPTTGSYSSTLRSVTLNPLLS